MASGCVLVERLRVERGVIGIVTLNRPSARNALTRNMLRDLTRALAELDKDDRVRCVVLRGEGRAFCAGIDLTAASGVFTGDADDKEYDAVGALERLKVPIVGAVHGACVTAGFEIALACDVIVASEDAFFHDTHCKWGIAPGTYSNTSLSLSLPAPTTTTTTTTTTMLTFSCFLLTTVGWGLSQKLPRMVGPNRARLASLVSLLLPCCVVLLASDLALLLAQGLRENTCSPGPGLGPDDQRARDGRAGFRGGPADLQTNLQERRADGEALQAGSPAWPLDDAVGWQEDGAGRGLEGLPQDGHGPLWKAETLQVQALVEFLSLSLSVIKNFRPSVFFFHCRAVVPSSERAVWPLPGTPRRSESALLRQVGARDEVGALQPSWERFSR